VGYFGGPMHVAAFAALLFFLFCLMWRERRRKVVADIFFALVAAFLAQGGWWIFLSTWLGCFRHFMPGLICFWCALALGIAATANRGRELMLGGLLAVGLGARLLSLRDLVPTSLAREPRLVAQLQARDFIMKYAGQHKDAVWVCGGWANFDLEYLLPEAGTFHDFRTLSAAQKQAPEILLVRSPDVWNWFDDPQLSELARLCDHQILLDRGASFRISRCPAGIFP